MFPLFFRPFSVNPRSVTNPNNTIRSAEILKYLDQPRQAPRTAPRSKSFKLPLFCADAARQTQHNLCGFDAGCYDLCPISKNTVTTRLLMPCQKRETCRIEAGWSFKKKRNMELKQAETDEVLLLRKGVRVCEWVSEQCWGRIIMRLKSMKHVEEQHSEVWGRVGFI